MTIEEVKRNVSMQDVLSRYGLRTNRAGFIRCPFHMDKTASMKIYKNDFHCYGCGANGDVIEFVQKMDGLSFRDAFISLGGTYEHGTSRNEKRHIMRDRILAERQRQKEKDLIERKKQRILELSRDISFYQMLCKILIPFSDDWCIAMEKRESSFFEWQTLWEEVTGGVK